MSFKTGFGEGRTIVGFVHNEDPFPEGNDHLRPTLRLPHTIASPIESFVQPNTSFVLLLTINDVYLVCRCCPVTGLMYVRSIGRVGFRVFIEILGV
jgi:hypothetical protein